MNSQKHTTGYRNNTKNKKHRKDTVLLLNCQVFLKKKPRTYNQINESIRGFLHRSNGVCPTPLCNQSRMTLSVTSFLGWVFRGVGRN
jgi:hypothetical protein